jgi:hypothetical protein
MYGNRQFRDKEQTAKKVMVADRKHGAIQFDYDTELIGASNLAP